jgi:hypothetical protein
MERSGFFSVGFPVTGFLWRDSHFHTLRSRVRHGKMAEVGRSVARDLKWIDRAKLELLYFVETYKVSVHSRGEAGCDARGRVWSAGDWD